MVSEPQRAPAEGCRLVCFRVESDEIAGSLSPVPTIAEAQAAAQALEDLNMTVKAYLINVLTDHAVNCIMDEVVGRTVVRQLTTTTSADALTR